MVLYLKVFVSFSTVTDCGIIDSLPKLVTILANVAIGFCNTYLATIYVEHHCSAFRFLVFSISFSVSIS